ncbi:MAG: hypothetical protein ACQPRH_05575 [Solitalea-like symbiont of Tyrophagus putrescentiae]
MKKLLLLTILFLTIVISCSKEKPLTTANSQNENKSLASSYPTFKNYFIDNCNRRAVNGKHNYIFPSSNDNMARVWVNEVYYNNPDLAWTMEYLNNGFVKFWSQNKGFWERQRALDLDWRNYMNDGSMNAVIWVVNGDSNQEWDLIGPKKFNSQGVIEHFQGVMVNRYSGHMLELRSSGRGTFAIGKRLYKNSEEEKYFKEHGNFDSYCVKSGTTAIWTIERF